MNTYIKQPVLIACVALLLAATIAWWLRRPPGPEDVVRLTVNALRAKDVETLRRLTYPDEVVKLGLTSEVVRTTLQDALWVRGVPGEVRYEQKVNHSGDEVAFKVYSPVFVNDWLQVVVMEVGPGEWRLALGQLLEQVAIQHASQGLDVSLDKPRLAERLNAFRKDHHLIGSRSNHVGYVYVPTNPAEQIRVEPMRWPGRR